MATATVETLTASVNVLQVGNRQITLSVARQLDNVSPFEIEPMGRVRLSAKGRSEYTVIGKLDDGSLATADYGYLGYSHQTGRNVTYEEHLKEIELKTSLEALPLIVLAGLK